MILTCKECGEELSFTELDLSKEELIVEPCKECINNVYDYGYERGKKATTRAMKQLRITRRTNDTLA